MPLGESSSPVFRAGETYAFSPDITKEEAHKAWVEVPLATFVAVDKNNDVFGTYYIKPNQPALGLTFVTVVTSFQKTPAARYCRRNVWNIRNVRPYSEAFDQCSTT